MKSIYTVCFVVVMLILNMVGINAQPTDSLRAYYPFNGNANDESGNGNDGTVFGATLTTDRFGNEDKAFNFDGDSDYITTTFIPNAIFSISLWYLKNSIQVDNAGILSTYSTSNYYGIYYAMNGDYDWVRCDNNSLDAYPNAKLTWQHIVVISDGNKVKVYKDKVKKLDFDATTNHADNIFFGSSRFNGKYFTGKIDDIRIFDYVLSESEIEDLYYEGGWTGGNGYPLMTIEEIQYQHPDSLIANGDQPSPFLGDTVRIRGVVMVSPVVDPQTDRRSIMWAGARWMTYLVDPDGQQYDFFDGVVAIQHDTTGMNKNTFFDLVDTADVVEFTVVIDSFRQTTQAVLLLNPVTPVNVISNLGQRPAPIELNISDFMSNGVLDPLAEKYEGMYVIIRNVISSDRNLVDGTFRINDGQGNSMLMHDQSGYFTLRAHRLTGLTDYQPPIDGSNINFIRCVIQTRTDGYYFVPLYPGDIEVATLPPGFLGDVNDDDLCNSTDALIILSYDVGLTIPPDFLARINVGFGDVNSDTFTNSTDALILLSFDVGIPVPFPVCETFNPPTAYDKPTTKNIGN